MLYASTSAAVAGAGVLALTDSVKNGYETVERSGRVAVGLAVCINEYGIASNTPESGLILG